MKITVISYSLTGNNEALATSIAAKYSAEHIRIAEIKLRNNITISLDMLFNRTPKVKPIINNLEDNDLVIFIGPVWMGHVAAPFRAYFKKYKNKLNKYAFVSISGGAQCPNNKIASELKKSLGKEPLSVINPYILELLPSDLEPTPENIDNYSINKEDIRNLTKRIVITLQDVI